MRKSFINTLSELAEQDERIILMTGDLGFMVLETFRERFPNRFFNAGVAEQNMVGMATGLAEAGYLPFVYSIATFASLRPYEFIRNGPVVHQLPVRIVAVGGGYEYGAAGISHYALEDIGVMRTQPGLTIIAPADFQQARSALLQTWDHPGPIYYRLGKNDMILVPGLNGEFAPGKAQKIRAGKDILLIAMGGITPVVSQAGDILSGKGIEATILVIASINPPPAEDLVTTLQDFDHALAIEAHYINGGIGSLVAEIIAEHNIRCQLSRCGIRKTPDGISGDEAAMLEYQNIDRKAIVETALSMVTTT